MTKTELIARLEELSKKLDRDLSTEGTNVVLEARIKEAEAELALLDGDSDIDGDSDGSNNTGDNTSGNLSDANTAGAQSKSDEATNVSRRRVKLYRTLDVWHHKKGVDRRNPKKVVRVREIVPEGEEIEVDADEAADIIREEHGRAV